MGATVRGTWAMVVAVGLTVPGWGQEPRPAKALVDLHGDPLPEGAIARLGTVRFRHPGAVHEVAFSPDGKLLAASSDDRNMVVVWERATGRKLREFEVARSGLPPTHLRFSPGGKRLYASYRYGGDSAIYAWDVETGSRVLGSSPDAREASILRKEAGLVRWDLDAGKELGRYDKPEGRPGAAARVGDRLLVTWFDGRSVVMWDAAQKKQLWAVETTREKNYPGLPMAFSSDGALFAVEAPPEVISVHESVTGKLVRRLERGADKLYYSLAISPDGRTVAGNSWDGSLRLWDLETGRERAKVPTIEGWATHVFFAPDSKTFATGGGNNAHAVLLWDTATGKPIDPFPGHTSPVNCVAFSPDGRTAATSSWLRGDPVVRFWDPQTGRHLRSLTAPVRAGVSAVAFSPDGRMLAGCGWSGDNKVWIWDIATGRELHVMAGHEAGCTCVAFSPDGKRLASSDAYAMGRYSGRLGIWDVQAGKRIREIRGTPGAIQRVLFTPDGRHVLAAADGVHVYDVETGQPSGEPFPMKGRVWGLALSADGRLLATCGDNGPVRLWELASHREIPLAGLRGTANDVGLSPDGRVLAVGGPGGGVVVFHWPSGETVTRLAGNAGTMAEVVFSPDGRRLATAGTLESSALVWDVAGLANRPQPAGAKPAEADLQRWWNDLRNDSPGEAYKAVWHFAASPEQSLPFLAKFLPPVTPSEPAAVTRLIDGLDSPQFQVREASSRELGRLGEAAAEALRTARKGDVSPEQARRIDQLLADLDKPVPGPEQLRAGRAVAALEQIGARKVLAGLAAGAEGARLTREAKAALERLKRAEQ